MLRVPVTPGVGESPVDAEGQPITGRIVVPLTAYYSALLLSGELVRVEASSTDGTPSEEQDVRIAIDGEIQPRSTVVNWTNVVGEYNATTGHIDLAPGGVSRLEVSNVGTVNNLALNGANLVVWTGATEKTLTGQTPSLGFVRHQNRGLGNLTIQHAGASSTAANRFALYDNADVVVPPGGMAETFYVPGVTPRNDAVLLAGAAAEPVPEVITATGITSFASGRRAQTASPGGIAGASGGFHGRCYLVRSDNTTNQDSHLVHRMNTDFTAGWTFCQTSATDFKFCALSGAPAFIQSPVVSTGSGDIGKITRFYWAHTGSALKIWKNGTSGGTTPITGFTPFSGPTTVGHIATIGNPGTTFTIYLVAGGLGVPSDADVAALDALVVAGNLDAAMPTVGDDHRWLTNNVSSIIDGPGTDDMTITGALTAALMDPAVFG